MKPIDILLNVAGIYRPSGLRFGNTPVDAWLEVLKINCIAALNSVIKSLSIDLQDKGVKSLAIHPGWVKTDMGGADAEISAQRSAAGIFKILSQPASLKSGGFYDYQGDELLW